jgi:hypothetical protein
MSFAQIAGDAAECPLSLFANPGRNRVPKTVAGVQPAIRPSLPTTLKAVGCDEYWLQVGVSH